MIGHPALAIFVGLATAITIFIISTSYSQIIQLFPGGGGGYIVASKLLSPMIGMVSGCSLLIDYVRSGTVIDLEVPVSTKVRLKADGKPWAEGQLCQFRDRIAVIRRGLTDLRRPTAAMCLAR